MEKSDELVLLKKFYFVSEAQILKGMLESNGIPAMVTEEYNPYGTAFSMSRVLVFAHDYEAACALMNAASMGDDALDAMAEEARE